VLHLLVRLLCISFAQVYYKFTPVNNEQGARRLRKRRTLDQNLGMLFSRIFFNPCCVIVHLNALENLPIRYIAPSIEKVVYKNAELLRLFKLVPHQSDFEKLDSVSWA
jgi:hypothetical protein